MAERPTILIVDDEITNLDLLVALFEAEYLVSAATNGIDALARAAQTPRPDLMLLDVMMPDMDGYEVCARLKASEQTKSIRSSSSRPGMRRPSRRADWSWVRSTTSPSHSGLRSCGRE
ncbi:MAG: response regulator [Candidatus Wallbacteria bacterium]|nr:response regulator [Candidatus Wallbacteria bacterium]